MHPRQRCAVVALLSFLASTALTACGSGGDPRNFNLALTPSELTVVADYTTAPFTLGVSPLNGYEGDVQLMAEPAAGLECVQPSCTLSTSSTASFRFNTEATLQPGEYPVVFHGTGGKYPHDVTAYVKVLPYDGTTPPPDFDFDVQPASYLFSTPARGSLKGTLNYGITFSRYNHYTGPITVSVAVQQGLSCGPCTLTTTGDSSTLVVFVSGASPAVYTNLFTATAPGVTKTATTRIVVTPPPTLPTPPGGP